VLADRADETGILGAPVTRINLADRTCCTSHAGSRPERPRAEVRRVDRRREHGNRGREVMMPAFERHRMILTMLDPYGVCFDWDSLESLTMHEADGSPHVLPGGHRSRAELAAEGAHRSLYAERRGLADGRGDTPQPGRVFREIYVEGLEKQLLLRVGVPKTIQVDGPGNLQAPLRLTPQERPRGLGARASG
jgi:hypothetical protein